MLTAVQRFLDACRLEFDQIPAARQAQLTDLRRSVDDLLRDRGTARVTFICTHNSRRSHLCQIWAKIAAERSGIAGFETYSGGTETTAMNARVAAALRRCGLTVQADDAASPNPTYRVGYFRDAPPIRCFSKRYDHASNPAVDFIAVMTCSTAETACPIVPGSCRRFAIQYEDPKVADGTTAEAAVYDQRCRQICREMLFAFGG
jgi:arsenate reductase